MEIQELIKTSPTLVDNEGTVLIHKDRVFRIIEDFNYSVDIKELLVSTGDLLFSKGLIRTWITDEFNDQTELTVLEHNKIPFILHPCEYTNLMYWEAAKTLVTLGKELAKYGYVLKDAHPFNLSFDGYKPVFFDFTSIIKNSQIPDSWMKEFITYFAIPIWIANKKKLSKLSIEYRREHIQGFGIKLFSNKYIQKLIINKLLKINVFKNDPGTFWEKLDKWLNKHKPIKSGDEYWSNYIQEHEASIIAPKTVKQKFVYKILSEIKPSKVLDLAANKGYYASMAANLGASTLAFDYEEGCVDQCLKLSTKEQFNITPAIMNFFLPTPSHGWGLTGEDSFNRLKSDIVLALGLIHHICIAQSMPVQLFCTICKKYAKKGIVLEFIDPSDKHVESWNKKVPKDYSIERIKYLMQDQFPKMISSEKISMDGINRIFLYFTK